MSGHIVPDHDCYRKRKTISFGHEESEQKGSTLCFVFSCQQVRTPKGKHIQQKKQVVGVQQIFHDLQCIWCMHAYSWDSTIFQHFIFFFPRFILGQRCDSNGQLGCPLESHGSDQKKNQTMGHLSFYM